MFGDRKQLPVVQAGRQICRPQAQQETAVGLCLQNAVAVGQLLRLAGGGAGKVGLPARIGDGRCTGGLHRQAQRVVGLAGNALDLADQPTGAERDLQRRGGQVGWQLDADRQQLAVAIAEIDQIADQETVGRRPVHIVGAQAIGQPPLQLGDQPGVTGIAPVGMPVRIVIQQQAEAQRLAGDGLGRFGNQLRAQMMRAAHRRGAVGSVRGDLRCRERHG